MNALEYVLSYEKPYKREGFLSASQLASATDYQLWLSGQQTPETYKNETGTSVNSLIGNAFHKYVEDLLIKSKISHMVEKELMTYVDGYKISGTCDLIEFNEDMNGKMIATFCDWKTKGVYQAKKVLKGDTEETMIQLSVYRYMFDKTNKERMINIFDTDDIGYMYMIITGDTGYFAKADGGGKMPKYADIPIKLMSIERTEKFIKYKLAIATGSEPVMDCEAWRCDYCRFECKYRMNNVE